MRMFGVSVSIPRSSTQPQQPTQKRRLLSRSPPLLRNSRTSHRSVERNESSNEDSGQVRASRPPKSASAEALLSEPKSDPDSGLWSIASTDSESISHRFHSKSSLGKDRNCEGLSESSNNPPFVLKSEIRPTGDMKSAMTRSIAMTRANHKTAGSRFTTFVDNKWSQLGGNKSSKLFSKEDIRSNSSYSSKSSSSAGLKRTPSFRTKKFHSPRQVRNSLSVHTSGTKNSPRPSKLPSINKFRNKFRSGTMDDKDSSQQNLLEENKESKSTKNPDKFFSKSRQSQSTEGSRSKDVSSVPAEANTQQSVRPKVGRNNETKIKNSASTSKMHVAKTNDRKSPSGKSNTRSQRNACDDVKSKQKTKTNSFVLDGGKNETCSRKASSKLQQQSAGKYWAKETDELMHAVVPEHLVDSVSEYNTDTDDRRASPLGKNSHVSSSNSKQQSSNVTSARKKKSSFVSEAVNQKSTVNKSNLPTSNKGMVNSSPSVKSIARKNPSAKEFSELMKHKVTKSSPSKNFLPRSSEARKNANYCQSLLSPEKPIMKSSSSNSDTLSNNSKFLPIAQRYLGMYSSPPSKYKSAASLSMKTLHSKASSLLDTSFGISSAPPSLGTQDGPNAIPPPHEFVDKKSLQKVTRNLSKTFDRISEGQKSSNKINTSDSFSKFKESTTSNSQRITGLECVVTSTDLMQLQADQQLLVLPETCVDSECGSPINRSQLNSSLNSSKGNGYSDLSIINNKSLKFPISILPESNLFQRTQPSNLKDNRQLDLQSFNNEDHNLCPITSNNRNIPGPFLSENFPWSLKDPPLHASKAKGGVFLLPDSGPLFFPSSPVSPLPRLPNQLFQKPSTSACPPSPPYDPEPPNFTVHPTIPELPEFSTPSGTNSSAPSPVPFNQQVHTIIRPLPTSHSSFQSYHSLLCSVTDSHSTIAATVSTGRSYTDAMVSSFTNSSLTTTNQTKAILYPFSCEKNNLDVNPVSLPADLRTTKIQQGTLDATVTKKSDLFESFESLTDSLKKKKKKVMNGSNRTSYSNCIPAGTSINSNKNQCLTNSNDLNKGNSNKIYDAVEMTLQSPSSEANAFHTRSSLIPSSSHSNDPIAAFSASQSTPQPTASFSQAFAPNIAVSNKRIPAPPVSEGAPPSHSAADEKKIINTSKLSSAMSSGGSSSLARRINEAMLPSSATSTENNAVETGKLEFLSLFFFFLLFFIKMSRLK